jgi:hypothetical protein
MVELGVGLVPSRTGELRRSRDLLVPRRLVEVRQVHVVVRLDAVAVKEDVDEVVRVGVVLAPTVQQQVVVVRGAVPALGRLDDAVKGGDLAVQADLLEVVLDDLRDRRAERGVERPEPAVPTAGVAVRTPVITMVN